MDWDIALYNQVTFLISVYGAALANGIFQPQKSLVLEVRPYGVLDDSYPGLFRCMDISFLQYAELDDSLVEAEFGKHMTIQELWTRTYKERIKSVPVRVNTTALESYLRRARTIWEENCKIE